MALDLQFNAGNYSSDISSIATTTLQNGTKLQMAELIISHPYKTNAPISMYFNLAYEENENKPLPTASLYALAFKTSTNVFHFVVDKINTDKQWKFKLTNGTTINSIPFPGKGGIDGSYSSLGWTTSLPNITLQNLSDSIKIIRDYNGKAYGAELKTALARIIIATIEAVRSKVVKDGIISVLDMYSTYNPPSDVIHNWASTGHQLGGT